MYLAGMYCDPRGRDHEPLEEVFAGEYCEEETTKGWVQSFELQDLEEEQTTVASQRSFPNSLSSSTTTACQQQLVSSPSAATPASHPGVMNAEAVQNLARAIWLLARRNCEICCEDCRILQTPGAAEQQLYVLLEWVYDLQREEEARRSVPVNNQTNFDRVETVLSAAFAISSRAHKMGAQCTCTMSGVARSAATNPATRSLVRICRQARFVGSVGEGVMVKWSKPLTSGTRLIPSFGLSSLVTRASKAVHMLTTNALEVTAEPLDVMFRDCGAVIQVIRMFCCALFIGSTWIDEEAPISTFTLSRFLMRATHVLISAELCAAGNPASISTATRWMGDRAAQFRRLASASCFSITHSPPPCSLCANAQPRDIAGELCLFEQRLCDFLSSINYNTRLVDTDWLKIDF